MKGRHLQGQDWLRFGVFLLLVAGMGLYVAARWQQFRLSLRTPVAAVPAAARAAATGGAAGAPYPQAPVLATPESAAGGGAAGRDFFAEYRMERDRARGQEREMLWQLMTGAATTEEARRQASLRYLALSTSMGLEAQLEGLIRGRGFEDAVVYLGEGTAQVVVKAPALSGGEAARIGDLVRQVAGIKPQAVTVVQRER